MHPTEPCATVTGLLQQSARFCQRKGLSRAAATECCYTETGNKKQGYAASLLGVLCLIWCWDINKRLQPWKCSPRDTKTPLGLGLGCWLCDRLGRLWQVLGSLQLGILSLQVSSSAQVTKSARTQDCHLHLAGPNRVSLATRFYP